jgi:hypothetical protein
MTRIPLNDWLAQHGGGTATVEPPSRVPLNEWLSQHGGSPDAPADQFVDPNNMVPPAPAPDLWSQFTSSQRQWEADSAAFNQSLAGMTPAQQFNAQGPARPVAPTLDQYEQEMLADPEFAKASPEEQQQAKELFATFRAQEGADSKLIQEQIATADREHAAWLANHENWSPTDWTKYNAELPLPITADVAGSWELRRKYARINELATGKPYLGEGGRSATEVATDRARMDNAGVADPAAWVQQEEAARDPYGNTASRTAGAVVQGMAEGTASTFDTLLGRSNSVRTRQLEQSWREGIESLKDADAWLPTVSNYSRTIGGVVGRMVPAMAAAAATKNPAAAYTLLGGQAGVDGFAEARAKGWSWAGSALYGAAAAAVETASEVAGGKVAKGLGLATAEEAAAAGIKGVGGKSIFANAIKNPTLRKTVEGAAGAILEGGEEVLADVLHSVKDTMAGIPADEQHSDPVKSFLIGMIAGGAMHVPAYAAFLLRPNQKTARAAGIPQQVAPKTADLEALAENVRTVANEQAEQAPTPQPTPTEPVEGLPPDVAQESTEAVPTQPDASLEPSAPMEAVEEPLPAGETTASVKMMITQADKLNLRALGFDDSLIATLTPQDAEAIIGGNIYRDSWLADRGGVAEPTAEESPPTPTNTPTEAPIEPAPSVAPPTSPASAPSVAAPVDVGVDVPDQEQIATIAAPEAVNAPTIAADVPERVPSLSAIAFREQLTAAATSPAEADALYQLVEARAEAAGESIDDYVGKRLLAVEKGPQSKSAGLRHRVSKDPRGEIQFLDDGRAIIRAFEGKQTVATLAHETGHLFRRDLSGEDAKTAADWAGAKNGKWSRAAEEKFARGFERYLRTGSAPTPKLAKVFEQFKTWLTSVYRRLKGSPLDVQIPAEMKAVYDRLFIPPQAVPAEVAAAPVDKPKLNKARREFNRMRKQGTVDEAMLDEIAGLPEQVQIDLFTTADALADAQNEFLRGVIDDYRHVVPSGVTGARARLSERRGGDAAKIPGFDEKLELLRGGQYPYLAAVAESRGNGDIESGLYDIVQGGRKQFEDELKRADEFIPDALEQYHASRSSEETGGVEDRGYPADWDSVEGSDEAGDAGVEEEAEADDFQLANTPPPPRPQEFENTAGEQQTFITGRGRDLPGQETLFDPDGVADSPPATADVLFQDQSRSPTSLKNAIIDQERAARGLPPMMTPERQSNPEVWDAAMRRMDRDPNWQAQLATDLAANPRSVDAIESAALLHLRIGLNNEYFAAGDAYSQALDSGDEVAMAAADARLQLASAKLDDFEDMNKAIGTAWGRAGVARKMMADEEYSLVAMELEARAAKGRPLTPEESAEIAKLQKRIADLETQLAEQTAASEKKAIDAAVAAALDEVRKTAPKTRPRSPSKSTNPKQPAKKGEASGIAGKASAARGELKSALSELRAAFADFDPDILSDEAPTDFNPKIAAAAAKVALKAAKAGAYTFAEFVNIVATELGPKAVSKYGSYFEAAWTNLGERLSSVDDAGSVSDVLQGAVQTAEQRAAVQQKLDAAKEPVRPTGPQQLIPGSTEAEIAVQQATGDLKAKIDKGEIQEIAPLVQKLAREFWTNGIREREAMIDALHGVLEPMIPGWTREQTQRAFSGYGDFKPLSKDEVSAGLADLKTQTQQVLKIDALNARKPLEKTGPERRPMSDAARRLLKQVNELKRKFGVVTTDPATQLRSALEARKTYYAHRLADLKHEIATRQRIVKGTSPSPSDSALEALKQEYAQILHEHQQLFGPKNLTDEQRLQLAIKTAARTERLWLDRLANAQKGKFPGPKLTVLPQNSFALATIKARTAQAKQQYKELQDLANPKKTPDEIALQSLKTRMATEEVKLREKLAAGDFTQTKRKPIVLDEAAARAKARLELVRNEYKEGLARDRRARMSKLEKARGNAADLYDASRTAMATGEFSFIGRQGLFLSVTHPVRLAKQALAALKAFASEENARTIEGKIESHPWFEEATRTDKLRWSKDTGPLSRQEEFAIGRWLQHLPGLGNIPGVKDFSFVRNSKFLREFNFIGNINRAGRVFLNKQRWDAYVAMRTGWSRFGAATEQERKQYSKLANIATGHGSLGQWAESSMVGAGRVFWSPRYAISRFQLLTMQGLWGGSWRSRAIVAEEYARFIAGMAAYYTILGWLFGDDEEKALELNPKSSDFGKVRVGDTRMDVFAGLAQVATMVDRVFTGETKTADGEFVSLRGEDRPANGRGVWDVLWKFAGSKLHPSISTPINLLAGEDLFGNPVTAAGEAEKLGTPMTYRDIYEALRDHGYTKGGAMGLLAFLGAGLQSYRREQKEVGPEYTEETPVTLDNALDAAKLMVSEGPSAPGKEGVNARRAQWQANRQAALDWLVAHKDDPQVREATDALFRSQAYYDTLPPDAGFSSKAAVDRYQWAKQAKQALQSNPRP